MRSGLVASCHDVSDGGLGVALAETAFSGGLGMTVDLKDVPRRGVERDDVLLFSETPGRFVVTVLAQAARAFEIVMGGAAHRVGYVSEDPRLIVAGLAGDTAIDADVFALKAAWKLPLALEEVR
jgi:phosphoribosylformylglycinamidine synthase